MAEQRGQKWLGGQGDGGGRQHSPLLQAPRQGLGGGSAGNSSKQIACRCDCQILRQAWASSPRGAVSSSCDQLSLSRFTGFSNSSSCASPKMPGLAGANGLRPRLPSSGSSPTPPAFSPGNQWSPWPSRL